METNDVFNHVIGGTVYDRIKGTGYFKRGRSFAVGETIVWVPPGTGARAATETWLNSAYHRSIMLHRKLRDFGIGVVAGSPFAGRSGGYTVTGVYAKGK
jgi:uncharacterized protein YkwD